MADQRKTIRRNPPEKAPERIPADTKKEIAFIALLCLSVLLILGIYTTSIGKTGTIADSTALLGPVGFFVKLLFTGLCGPVAYLLPVLSLAAGFFIVKTRNDTRPKTYVYVSGAVFTVCLAALFYLFGYAKTWQGFSLGDAWTHGMMGEGGGVLGMLLGFPLRAVADFTGATIIIIALMLCAFVAMTDFSVTRAIVGAVRRIKHSGKEASPAKEQPEAPAHPVTSPIGRYTDAATDIVPDGRKKKKSDPYVPLTEAVEELPHTGEPDAAIRIFSDPIPKEGIPPLFTPDEAKKEPLPDEPVIVKPKRLEGEIPVEITPDDTVIPYTFPDTSLLSAPAASAGGSNPSALRELSAKLVETLKSFGIDVKVLEINKGPAITRFELQPTAGVRVSKITSLADDIALALAATSVRIEAPIPGKAAIGIEIPNDSIATVTIRDVLENPEFRNSKSLLSIALGRDIAGKCIVGDIAKMPHVLIAGATGSGKSVCINSLITSILYKASPNDVKLIMIDPKVVELKIYDGIPHLLIPVVTDPRKAAGALNWAVQEMTTRYRFFADNNVRDLKGYNALMREKGMPTLPQIVIIIDELADLMMVAPKDVESYVCRLAQLARAAGMHLVIATQRPSVDVITGVIKANIPSRIAFAVSSYVDSRTILDEGGAEKLLGRGDMLFYPMGASKPTRVQGAFISDEEVEKLVEFVKKDSEAHYDEDIIEKMEKADTDASGEEDEDDGGNADSLLPKAIEIVLDAGQASASLVQRRLSVGYSRAGRLIDQMETRGIIGPHEGSKPRRVLITKAEYLAMSQNADAADAATPAPDADPSFAEDVYMPEATGDEDDLILPPGGMA